MAYHQAKERRLGKLNNDNKLHHKQEQYMPQLRRFLKQIYKMSQQLRNMSHKERWTTNSNNKHWFIKRPNTLHVVCSCSLDGQRKPLNQLEIDYIIWKKNHLNFTLVQVWQVLDCVIHTKEICSIQNNHCYNTKISESIKHFIIFLNQITTKRYWKHHFLTCQRLQSTVI